MAKNRNLDTGDVLPASWTDGIQEFIGTLVAGVDLSLASNTVVQIVASPNSGQAAVGIDGLWRYRSTTVQATVSGAAGTYDLFVTAGPNSYAATPAPDTDNTVYDFGLVALLTGSTPTLTASLTNYRALGQADWDGSKVTGLRQTEGSDNSTNPAWPISPNANVTPLMAQGATGQVAPLVRARVGTGSDVFTVSAGGVANVTGGFQVNGAALASTHLSDSSALARIASPSFTGTPAAPTAAADTSTTQLATAAFVIGQASAVAPTMDGAAAVGTSLRYARADHVHATDTSRAPLASPTFTGVPASPTAAPGTNTTQLATTAFVTAAVASVSGGTGGIAYLGNAQTFTAANTFSGLVTASGGVDLSSAAGPLAGAGVVLGDKLALYGAAASAYGLGVQASTLVAYVGTGGSFGVRAASATGAASSGTNAVTLTSSGNVNIIGQYQVNGAQIASGALSDTASLARLAGPTFTGVPAAPTAAVDTNTTQLATTAYVIGQGYLKSAAASAAYQPLDSDLTALAAIVTTGFYANTGVGTVAARTITGTADLTVTNGDGVAGNPTLTVAGTVARLASPTFTGTPAAPTAAGGTNTTQLATTAFVAAAVAPLAPLASPTFTGTVNAGALTVNGTSRLVDGGGATLSFYGVAGSTRLGGYGAGAAAAPGSKASLGSSSSLYDVVTVLSSLIADLRSYGLIGS